MIPYQIKKGICFNINQLIPNQVINMGYAYIIWAIPEKLNQGGEDIHRIFRAIDERACGNNYHLYQASSLVEYKVQLA